MEKGFFVFLKRLHIKRHDWFFLFVFWLGLISYLYFILYLIYYICHVRAFFVKEFN